PYPLPTPPTPTRASRPTPSPSRPSPTRWRSRVDPPRAEGTCRWGRTLRRCRRVPAYTKGPGMAAVTRPSRTRDKGRLFDRKLLAGIAVVGTLLVFSLFIGVYDVFGTEDGGEMFSITRIPRTIALVLAGAAMAMSGLVMQLLTQNRFVEPTTTGTTEWAGLGLLTVMLLVPG